MPVSMDTLLENQPRLSLALLPTPLRPLLNLQASLGPNAPRIFIKRDDLTGLALGGNKARKLEYLLADARRQGADTLLTCGAAQSNHALQTSAAARKFGFDVRCVLYGSLPAGDSRPTGNLLLHHWLNTPLSWVQMQPGETRREAALQRGLAAEAEAVRQTGGVPYVIPTGGSTPVGSLGYVRAVQEVQAQWRTEQSDSIDAVFVASGSGGTHAGMAVGAHLLGWETEIFGVDVDPLPLDADGHSPFHHFLLELANQTLAHLNQPANFTFADLNICTGYGGTAYGVPTPAGEEAIRLLALTEGIFSDPVYTGKALSALIGEIRKGRFRPDQSVLFWHTGGVADFSPDINS